MSKNYTKYSENNEEKAPVAEEKVETIPEKKKMTITVSVDNLNVRITPGFNGERTGDFAKVGTFDVEETKYVDGKEWAKVPDFLGWVCAEYATLNK